MLEESLMEEQEEEQDKTFFDAIQHEVETVQNPFRVRNEGIIVPDEPHEKEMQLKMQIPSSILKSERRDEHSPDL